MPRKKAETKAEEVEKGKEEKKKKVSKAKKEQTEGKVSQEKRSLSGKEKKKEEQTLVPIDDYVKAGIYIGTKVITPHMRKYVYRRRADGLAIINTNLIDENLKEAAKILAEYEPEDFIVVCKREGGWLAVNLFSELTGVRVFTKKYPAGILTNSQLPDFFETKLIFICDPWLDKNALSDANKVKRKVMALCDTNNFTFGVDYLVPCNNKSNKSLGLVFYILTREYLKAKKIKKKLPGVEEFIGEKLEGEIKRKVKKKEEEKTDRDIEKIERIMRAGAEEGV